ncbi:MAG TPA: hypothetical protein VNN80_06975, partial [Polyangiaceae bacterium]|nr:hypothetical protein [Polyangiaceae bacterium]
TATQPAPRGRALATPSRARFSFCIGVLVACGGAPAAPPAAPAPDSAAEVASVDHARSGADDAPAAAPLAPTPVVPDSCADPAAAECVPPAAWVSTLCNGVYAEVALAMFRGGTPWQRRYLLGKTRAVNASGGATVEGSLSRDEEVIVLRHREGGSGGMQVGDGSGQYDALRWNGSCVSLEAGEVTARRPRAPGQAHIEWSWLGDGMRGALRRDAAVNEAFVARKKECRGATSGTVTKACERLDATLNVRIAEHVRSGPELPVPEQHP